MQSSIRKQSLFARTVARKRLSLASIIFPAVACCGFPVMADWRDAKALREELGNLVAEAEAIGRICAEENREPSADESKRLDQILGVGKKGEADYRPGLIDQLEQRIVQREKLEKVKDEIVGRFGGGTGTNPAPNGRQLAQQGDEERPETDSIVSRIRVPSSVYRPGQMKAFKVYGSRAENERAAYAFGQFALATIAKHPAATQFCVDNGIIRAGANEGTPADGGYLVPSELDRAVTYVRDMHGVFRQEAERVPMSSDTKDRAKQTAGLPYYYPGEATAITATGKMVFTNVALVAKKVAAIAKMSSELGEDAIMDVGDQIAMCLGEAFALAEDQAGFLGDGTSTYGSQSGIIGLIDVTTPLKGLYVPAGISTLAGLTNTHFRKIISMIPGKFRRGCKWYCNSTVYDACMAPILDAAGGNTQSDLEQGPGRLRFKGYDVRETQCLPDEASIEPESNVLIFGNLQAGAMFGDRRGILINRSDQVYWTTDEIGIKGTERFNAKIHEQGATDAVGAFVVLQLDAAE